MNQKEIWKIELKIWLIKFVLVSLVLFAALAIALPKLTVQPATDDPNSAIIADSVFCESGTVFARNLDVKDHIYYDEDFEFNILDAEVKDGQLILYRAHGDPVIFSVKGE